MDVYVNDPEIGVCVNISDSFISYIGGDLTNLSNLTYLIAIPKDLYIII